MTTFVNAVRNQSARTANGMKARASTTNACVDLFFKIGASRGKDIIPDWTAARVQDADLASRIALWARDVRGGAGERQLFRNILADLAKTDKDRCIALMRKVPEIGRWDDLLVPEIMSNEATRVAAYTMIKNALEAGAKAKHLLEKIDTMSEEECQKILDSYNGQNGVSS